MTEYKLSTCKSCHARIIWALSPAGRRMPVDAVRVRPPSDEDRKHCYNVERMTAEGPKLRKMDDIEKHGHLSHFRTCPTAQQHSKAHPQP